MSLPASAYEEDDFHPHMCVPLGEEMVPEPNFYAWDFYLCSLSKAFLCVKLVIAIHMGFESVTLYSWIVCLPRQVDELMKLDHGQYCRLGSLLGGL